MPSFTVPCPHCGSANEDLSGVLLRARGAMVRLACKHCGRGFRSSLRDCLSRGEDTSCGSPMGPAGVLLSGSTSAGRERRQEQGYGAQDLLDANLELAEYLASGPSEKDLDELDVRCRVSSKKGCH